MNPIERSIELKERGEFQAALDELETAIREGLDLARAHYQQGLTLVAMDRTDEAILAYETAIGLRPDYLKALVNLAGIYMARQDATAAGRLLQKAERVVDADDPIFLTNRAALHRMTGKATPAIRDAQRATELAPAEAGVWAELGMCLLLDPRRSEDSAAASRRALELAPEHSRAAHNLAFALDRLGRHAEALPLVKQAIAGAPEDLGFAQTAACILLHLDRAGEAMPLLEAVERGRPDNFEAQYNLACGLAKTGQTERALDHVRRAIELVPPNHRKAFIAHVPNDPDLAALRGLPGFVELAK